MNEGGAGPDGSFYVGSMAWDQAEGAAALFRVDPDLKAALETAAKQDSRSVSSLVVKILIDWARAQGLLK